MRALIVSTVLLLATAAQPLAAQCLDGKAKQAQKLRHMQMQFMVGALACRSSDAAVHIALYNDLLTRFGPDLRAQQDLLMTRFKLAFGQDYIVEYERYLTVMANRISLNMAENSQFCAELQDMEPEVYAAENLSELIPAAMPLAPAGLAKDHPVCLQRQGIGMSTAE